MEPFLKIVAKDLYTKLGADLSRTAVVFPNKRASLFFNEHLAEEAGCPIWSPAYLSISDLYRSSSSLQPGDPVKLVCELYKVFCQETKSNETLDEFYFWGELLISDFDDVDKNLVDADKLFSNLSDLKNIMDDYHFIDPEQEAAIQQFFSNFSIERHTQLKERFISLWDALANIYRLYKERLASQGIAYEGMLYRSVIENFDVHSLPYERYVFVGFNVLNKVEKQLFETLSNAGKALFYWDYDKFYLGAPGHEAGEFLRRNLRDFPSELTHEAFDSLSHSKQVKFISASTENAQARFLPRWIRENVSGKESESAVVLCNESLLLPVLHSIPPEVNNINITMGFPLAQTPAFSLVYALLELQTSGFRSATGRYSYASVVAVLKHPYCRRLSSEAEKLEKELTRNNRFYPVPSELKKDAFLALVFTPQPDNAGLCTYLTEILQKVAEIYQKERESSDTFNQLYRESLFKAFTTVNRFKTLIESADLAVSPGTLKRLLSQVLSSSNIPFHGEPAIGMQVMGVLETRNLDFRNIVMLSLNEGQLPKTGGESSFIPYNLRKAFGMTTIEHKNAVYAYYFYRLMQRAENITLMYNTSCDGLNRGEWSRFMLQFLIEWPHEITRSSLQAGQSPQATQEITVSKTQEVMRRLQNHFDIRVNPKARFSPSALNTYLDCKLKFYYQYVARIKSANEVSSEIDSATFGSIFHYAAELAYRDLTATGKTIRKEDLETLLRNEVRLQNYVDSAFKKIFFNVPEDERPEYNGIQLINSAVITTYLKQLFQNDLRYAPFYMEAMEEKIHEDILIKTPNGSIHSRIGGVIDRIDTKGGMLRIVDYKTGGSPKIPADIESLFVRSENRPNYVFQTFLYAAIVSAKREVRVAPSLLYIHRAASEAYSPVIEMGDARRPKIAVDDFSLYQEEFREKLSELLEEIFNPDNAFTQTEIAKTCEYCDFKAICKR